MSDEPRVVVWLPTSEADERLIDDYLRQLREEQSEDEESTDVG